MSDGPFVSFPEVAWCILKGGKSMLPVLWVFIFNIDKSKIDSSSAGGSLRSETSLSDSNSCLLSFGTQVSFASLDY